MHQKQFYVGVDWASQSHHVCVLKADGDRLGEQVFKHTGEGLARMAGWILKLAQSEPELVQVAIEVPHGPVVESLLNRGFQVHSINPRQLDRFRDRFSPAGAKDDSRDAHVLADALRTDPRCLRRLEPLDPLLVELREWSRIVEELTRLRTRLSHRLRDQLWHYYPQFLDLGSDLANNWMLALWAVVPTPDRARMVSKATIAKLLKTHRIRRLDAAGVLARLRTDPLPVAAGTTAAATAHIQVLSSSLNMLNEQLSEALERLEHCTEQLAASNDKTATEPARQSDGAILMSLPGVGRTVLATLLAEASDPLRRRDYHALRCLSGVAPVTRSSGNRCIVVRRLAAHRRLNNAVYHWSRVAVQHDRICRAKYDALRLKGHNHARALRSVAARLLAVACAMLASGTLFDPEHAVKQSAA